MESACIDEELERDFNILLVYAYEQGNFGSLISNLPIKITCDLELDLQGKVMSGQVRSICLFSSFKCLI